MFRIIDRSWLCVTKNIKIKGVYAGNPAKLIREIQNTIKFLDLKAQYNKYKKEIDKSIYQTINKANFIGGDTEAI